MELNTNKKGYYKYLDTYRFIAVFFVICTHWMPKYLEKLPLSKLGVDMFFVLSGFLITEILIETFENDKGYLMKKVLYFYIRRSLRILPIYFITIGFFFLLKYPEILKDPAPYFLYYVNFYIICTQNWKGMFSHLWSLSVEEQFYCSWPFILIALKNAKRAIWFVGMITLSLLYLSYSLFFTSDKFSHINTLSCVSTICLGALLAELKHNKQLEIVTKNILLRIIGSILPLGLLFFFTNRSLYILSIHICFGLFSFFSLAILITKDLKLLDFFFLNKFFSFLGKISYGLYLFHNFIPWLINKKREIGGFISLNELLFPFIEGSEIRTFIVYWLVLILLATVSWFILEKPINSVKKFFPKGNATTSIKIKHSV